MKFCVIKSTTKVIDGSENPLEIMLQNAENSGFTETDIEVLTEEEYEARRAQEPPPPQEPTSEQRLKSLEDAMLFLTLGGM